MPAATRKPTHVPPFILITLSQVKTQPRKKTEQPSKTTIPSLIAVHSERHAVHPRPRTLRRHRTHSAIWTGWSQTGPARN